MSWPSDNVNPDGTWRLPPDEQVGGITIADGSYNWFTNSVYFPDSGATGPYCVAPLGGQLACGGGLPYGEHWSLWLGYEEIVPNTVYDNINEWFKMRR